MENERLEGVKAQPTIDWNHWQNLREVRVWEAVLLSLGQNPDVDELDVEEVFTEHREARKRLRLLSSHICDREYFTPASLNMGDSKLHGVVLSEFAAWWVQTQNKVSIPTQLVNIGESLVFERRAKRRKEIGRYTLEEAAEAIANGGGERDTSMLRKLKDAARKGNLTVYEPGRNAVYEYGTGKDAEVVREFYEEACCNDLNAWLEANEKRITFRFPAPAELKPEDGTPSTADIQGELSRVTLPGKLPRTAAGELAVEAAWEIECETGRAATDKAVMARLQEWAIDGTKPETLLSADKGKREVQWRTLKGRAKVYDIEACGKTLKAWLKTRA